ncbi:MAG: TIGR01906 family membrane protein [Dehalococcoidia bacterium]|nr:TIGR01906 family membrane protein [Dehalococcoidia bacterium]MDW8119852.1 TIGR01906 family membrane protein [Chloroflexota bacterium]
MLALTVRVVFTGATWLFTVLTLALLPIFCVTTSVRLAINALPLYTYGFQRFGVSEVTGIAPADLERVARAFIAYFNGPQEWLEVRVPVRGVERSLFNQREVIHMRDVRVLVRGVYRVQEVSGGVIALGVLLGFLKRGRVFVGRVLLVGGWLALGVLVVAGVALAVAFPWLFTLFHIIAFRNPYWQLDPSRDMLIQLFPEGFWYLATMVVAGASLAQATLVMALGWVLRRRTKRG